MAQPQALKALVRRFYAEILAGGELAKLGDLVAPEYTAHVPRHAGMPVLAPGRQALHARLGSLGPVPAAVKRIVADGEMVFVQVLYETRPAINGADIFRFDEQGRIAAHWNLRQSLAGESEAEIAQRFAGPGDGDAPFSNAQAAANAARAAEMYREMWSKGNPELAMIYLDPGYIQHNPHIQSGAARIRDMIATDIRGYMAHHRADFPVHLHHIGAQGDLVFAHFEIAMAGLGKNDGVKSAIMDIFRVDENNKFAEHWDVLQMESETPPEPAILY